MTTSTPCPPNGALVVRGLGVWHGHERDRREVFSGLSLSVEPGTVLAVTGPNGCGKTTLLRVLAGLLPPGEGQVERPHVPGRPLRVALVPQSPRATFFGWASLRVNIALGAAETLASLRAARSRADALRDELGLPLDLGLRPQACSEGMLQQAALLRALARAPDLLLADEPFSSLDLEAARSLRRAVRETVTRRALVAVVVLHDLESVLDLADRVLVIPDRPSSSEDRAGFARAVVLDNRWRGREDVANAPGGSFLRLMETVLSARDLDG